MEQRHLLLVDEQSQKDRLERIKESLKNDGIELIYQEIDPTQFTERQENGDSIFNKDRLKDNLRNVPLLSHLDVFATDYNLIEERYVHSPKELIPGFRKMLPLSEIYSILPYFISTPSLSYCLRLPVGGSVSVMLTTAVRERERAMLSSKASMC